MTYRQTGEFAATESTSKKHCKQGPIPFALDPIAIWSLPERAWPWLACCMKWELVMDDATSESPLLNAQPERFPHVHARGWPAFRSARYLPSRGTLTRL